MEEREVDLRDYIRVVVKRWKVVAIVFVAAVLTSAVVSYFFLPKVYEARATIEIGYYYGGGRFFPLEDVNAFINRFSDGDYEFLGKIAGKMNRPLSPKDVRDMVKAEAGRGERMVNVTVRGTKPEEISDLARAILDVVMAEHEEAYVQKVAYYENYIETKQREIDSARSEIAAIEAKIRELEGRHTEADARIAASYIGQLEIIRNRIAGLEREIADIRNQINFNTKRTRVAVPLLVEDAPVSPRPKLNILIAGVVALVVGLGLIFVMEYLEGFTLKEKGNA
ncbi:MAG: Wzz/FepE/Etk N-terminal domain-containing protein [bacterium]